jgi:mono/diheme cytochrome c family protein
MAQLLIGVAVVAAMLSGPTLASAAGAPDRSLAGGQFPGGAVPVGLSTAGEPKAVTTKTEPPVRYAAERGGSRPAKSATGEGTQPPPEYGELLAKPEELASYGVNVIARSIRLNGTAQMLGRKVYDQNCAVCHGPDLKGSRDTHAPDLTDANWMFSGDDLPSGGVTKFPSDVEWTVRYGIRSGHPNARGVEADMLAYDPKYRNKHDTEDFGNRQFLTTDEIGDVVEYVLKISSQEHDAAKAARGDKLFHDNAKGNCSDCHTDEGTGNDAIGSQNLTQKELYLYGSDRATITETINRGRRGVMPSFDRKLSPAEIKAVSVFVFARAKN